MFSFVHWSSYIIFDYVSAYICITAIQQYSTYMFHLELSLKNSWFLAYLTLPDHRGLCGFPITNGVKEIKRFSVSPLMIPQTTAGSFHGMNWFGHMIHVPYAIMH